MDTLAGIASLAAQINELQRQAARTASPVVEDIIRTRSRDVQQIEHTLDRLLDCACVPEGLVLFKALCRYYYTLNPSAAVDYVNAYRELWEEDALPNPTSPRT